MIVHTIAIEAKSNEELTNKIDALREEYNVFASQPFYGDGTFYAHVMWREI